MTDMRASLTVTADATGLLNENRQAITSMQQLVDANTGVSRAFKNAGDSADVFGREMREADAAIDRLRASVDPASAALRRMEAGERTLAAAVRAGSIDVAEQDRLLGLLRAEYAAVTTAQARMAAGQRSLLVATRGGAGGLQNVAFQVQDFATQVGAGTAASVALGQQLPQLLSGFGLIGALAGTAAAVLIPLGSILLSTGDDAEESGDVIEEAMDRAKSAVSALAAAQEIARAPIRELRAEYGLLADQVRDLAEAEAQLATIEAQRGLSDALAGLARSIGTDASQSIAELEELQARIATAAERIEAIEAGGGNRQSDRIERVSRGIADQLASLASLRENLGLSIADAQELQVRFAEAAAEKDNLARAEALGELRQFILEATNSLGGMSDEGIVILRLFLNAEREAANLAATTDEVGAAGARAAAGVDLISDAFGRAQRAAQGTLASMIATRRAAFGALEDAQIRLDGRGDPVGTAGDLAVARFRRQNELDRPDLVSQQNLQAIARQEREIRSLAEAAAAAQEELNDLNAADRGSASGGRAAASAAARQANQEARAAERDRARTIADIARQLDRIAPSYERDLEAAEAWREEALANLDPAREGYEAFAADVQTVFDGLLAEAYEDDLERRTDWQAGLERGLREMGDGLTDWASATQNLVTGWGEGLEEVFVNFARTGKLEVGDLVDFTLSELARLAYQRSIQPAVGGVFDMLAGGLGGLFSPGMTTGDTGALFGLSGSQLVPGYSHAGSTIGQSDLRATGGLRGDERLTVTRLGQRVFTPRQIENGSAVVDALAMAAQRPVVVQGGGGGDIVINNYGGGRSDVEQTGDGGVRINLGDMAIGAVAESIGTGNGPINRAIQSTYRVQRNMGGRS